MKASTIRASADGNTVELWMISEISTWTSTDFMFAVKSYGADKAYILNIFSPGGDPFAAFAIADYIKATGVKVTSRIWGHAASAAAIIAASTDRVEMGELSHLMIHNAYGGNSPELLDSLNAKQVEVFAAKTGKRGKDIAAMMDSETWMDAKTAKREGFADAIISELAIAALYKAQYMEENKTPEVVEETPATTENVEVTETPETPEATDVIEQEVEITAADMVQAALGRKKRVTFKVSSHFTSTINALAAEVKEKATALSEAEGEIERLKERLAAAEAAKQAAETAATAAQADVEKVQAMFNTVKAELESVSAEPVAPATPAPVTDSAVQEPGKMTPAERAQTKQTKREAEMREAYQRFAPKPKKA